MPAGRIARAARPALALAAALLLAGGLGACGGSPHNPAAYTRGYDAGLTVREHLLGGQGAPGDLVFLCAQAEYAGVQHVAESIAQFWEDGFNLGCANRSF